MLQFMGSQSRTRLTEQWQKPSLVHGGFRSMDRAERELMQESTGSEQALGFFPSFIWEPELLRDPDWNYYSFGAVAHRCCWSGLVSTLAPAWSHPVLCPLKCCKHSWWCWNPLSDVPVTHAVSGLETSRQNSSNPRWTPRSLSVPSGMWTFQGALSVWALTKQALMVLEFLQSKKECTKASTSEPWIQSSRCSTLWNQVEKYMKTYRHHPVPAPKRTLWSEILKQKTSEDLGLNVCLSMASQMTWDTSLPLEPHLSGTWNGTKISAQAIFLGCNENQLR